MGIDSSISGMDSTPRRGKFSTRGRGRGRRISSAQASAMDIDSLPSQPLTQ